MSRQALAGPVSQQCLMSRHSLAREERVSVAIGNSLSPQGIAASYHDSERGVTIGVGHDRAGQAKPSTCYRRE